MVRGEVAARKIAAASSRLDQADELLSRTRDEFLADRQGRDLAAFYLFLAIQECVDLATHWVADSGWPAPDSAGGSFDSLADHGVIDAPLATAMWGAVGLRNRIAHGYALLDHERIYDEAREGMAHLRRFLALAADQAGL
jgi:uncharacterized protein YutE (UPF0331/DUF86 family)